MIDPSAIEAVLAIFVPLIHNHRKTSSTPFVLGLSGLQGSGKSTWATALSQALTTQHNLQNRTLSLDDLYLDHAELKAIKEANSANGLLQTRGQPGTHDEVLARAFFDQVLDPKDSHNACIKWPAYDKSLYHGQGGRVPVENWEEVPLDPGLDVLIFEGWCLGFQPLDQTSITQKWERAKAGVAKAEKQLGDSPPVDTLALHELDHLQLINENLKRYCETFAGPQHFDGFLHLSTDELGNVYDWRLDQERALRKQKTGMSDEQVIAFVRGYMPAYELYLERLQHENFFKEAEGGLGQEKHVQAILNKRRDVIEVKDM